MMKFDAKEIIRIALRKPTKPSSFCVPLQIILSSMKSKGNFSNRNVVFTKKHYCNMWLPIFACLELSEAT